jgi:hypothetical protein
MDTTWYELQTSGIDVEQREKSLEELSVYSMLIKRLTLLLIDIFFFMTGEWPGYPPASWRR